MGARAAPSRPLRANESRRPEVVVHRRAGDREQEARRPHGVGADAQGRLPALQGAAGLRPALPERLRLPGAVDRGRRRAAARASTRSARSRSTASRSSPRAAARSSSSRREQLTRGSIRLGQWMDWGNDYFTFSDTNIEYIWRFLKIVNERGWLYSGHRATAWCPRCGTSLSQHELTQSGVYQEKSDPSLYVRFPLLDRPGESIVIWTTTPWTLPANVAAAVHPEGEYGLRENGEWVLAARFPDDTFVRAAHGNGARRLALRGAVRQPRRRAPAVEHRVVPWDEVSLDQEQGTGIVHIATGLRPARTSSSARSLGLPVLTPGRRGRPLLRRLRLAARPRRRSRPADQIVGDLAERGFLVEAGTLRPRLRALLALRHADHLPPLRRLVHRGRRASARSCSRRTRRSSGCPSTWASAWTTGCATWATGTSRAAATTACRCRSTRARAGT